MFLMANSRRNPEKAGLHSSNDEEAPKHPPLLALRRAATQLCKRQQEVYNASRERECAIQKDRSPQVQRSAAS